MKNSILIAITLSMALLITACCGDCNGAYLGQFLIKDSSEEWVDFATTQTRLFKGPGNQTAVFTYSPPNYVVNPDVYNCEVDDCGTCCDEFELEVISFGLNSDDINVNFVFTMQPDFINFTPLDQPAAISDYLTIGMSNKLFADLYFSDLQLRERVTVNGEEYRNVFAAELERTSLDTTSRDPWAFYLEKNRGIVAYKLANGEEWSLAQ